MRITTHPLPNATRAILWKERLPIGAAVLGENGEFTTFSIAPAWRRRGYGRYFMKELLRQAGGYAPGAASCFTAPLPPVGAPARAAALAFGAQLGFLPQNGQLCRRRTPDLTAVAFLHTTLQSLLHPGGFYLDATCGNGHDTLFLAELAGPQGRVLGLDIQPAAVAATNARLAAAGYETRATALCADHQFLARYTPPAGADCVLFNFGWLPGGSHDVFSTAASTLPALQAGLTALKPGGVLAVVLYSGKGIGHGEKDAALAFLQALPLAQYTVLVCRFANWADTAPLPCLVLKKGTTPP
ncbi:MAG: class I SAM-dependent methyltransferase [Gemmiger sp.]|nr:class I SAM-dependent methyltransferase [Gemmiger sp.]